MEKEQLSTELQTALDTKNLVQLSDLARYAVEHYEDDAFGYAFLAESFLIGDEINYPKAETCLAKAIQLEKENIEYKLRFAAIKEQQGLYDDAQILYLKILSQDPHHAFALLSLGLYELRISLDTSGALEYFDKALAADASNTQIHQYRAEALIAQGRLEEAEQALALVAKGAFDESIEILKISLYKELHREQEVMASYQRLIEHCPDILAYRFNYGMELYEQEHYAEAAVQLAKTVALRPAEESFNSLLFSRLGTSLLRQQQFQEAKLLFDQCIEHDAKDTEAYFQRAEALTGLQEYEAALSDLEVVAKQAKGDEILSNIVLAQEGAVLVQMNKLAEAEKIFTKLRQSKLHEHEADFGMGLIHQKKGDMDGAYKLIKNARKEGSPKAKLYLKQHFSEYLKGIEQTILDNNQAEFAKNAQSPIVQKLQGTLWVFDTFKSKKLQGFPPSFIEKLSETLQVYCMVFTERGIAFINENKKETFTYKIDKAGVDAMQIIAIPTDGFPSYPLRLKLDADGGLLYSKDEGEFLKFKKQELASLPLSIKANFKEQASKAEIAFLGKGADAIVNAIFN